MSSGKWPSGMDSTFTFCTERMSQSLAWDSTKVHPESYARFMSGALPSLKRWNRVLSLKGMPDYIILHNALCKKE